MLQGFKLIQTICNYNYDWVFANQLQDEQRRIDFLCKLEKLEDAANVYIEYFETFYSELRRIFDAENDISPSKILEKGSYYLRNAYRLVEIYKTLNPGLIDDKNIQLVNDTLVGLEFNPKHLTSGCTNRVSDETVICCFVSRGHGTKYYDLLHSEFRRNILDFVHMVQDNIDKPIKRFLKSIKPVLQSILPENLLDAIENDNYSAIEKCIKKGVVVNFKDFEGRTPLHNAVDRGNIVTVNILLKNGADTTQNTNAEGETALHLATSKNYKEIVEHLLQHTNCVKLNNFVNSIIASSGTTSLHLAAENNSFEIVVSLLEHGASYNIKNKEGQTPLDLSKNQSVINLLKLVKELFEDAKNGDFNITSKLGAVKCEEFLAVANARNNEGDTLLQVAIINKHEDIANQLKKKLKKIVLDQLGKLECCAKVHIEFSDFYLPTLQSLSKPFESEKNISPWKTLKEGSYYLRNAYCLVKEYKKFLTGLIDDNSIQTVNDLLVELEFHPSHVSSGYTDEAYAGMAKCFVSKGQGTKYYKLLHSESKKDIRQFIKMVELDIEIPVRKFLESVKQRLQTFLPEKLLDAIKNNDHSKVEECIKKGVVVNFRDTEGRTPLHYAVDHGNIVIVNTLLENKANATQHTSGRGQTLLDIAISKNDIKIVENLLQHVNCAEINDFVNARTASNGATSLHVAAESGSLKMVASLLKHGASYNILNKNRKTPFDLSKNQSVIKLLKLVEELFEDARNGDVRIISKLTAINCEEILAATNARNNLGSTLLQVTIVYEHKHITCQLLEMLKKFKLDQQNEERQTQFDHFMHSNIPKRLILSNELYEDAEKGNVGIISKLESVNCKDFLQIGTTLLKVTTDHGHKNVANQLLKKLEKFVLEQLEKLENAAKNHIQFSKIYLAMLESISRPYASDNISPWKILNEGSYYLENAYRLVEIYKNCVSDLMDDESIESVNNMLVALEFDPKHIKLGHTDNAFGGKAICFTKYYELLYSESKTDKRQFIEMVQPNIDIPIIEFLKSMKPRLQYTFSEKLRNFLVDVSTDNCWHWTGNKIIIRPRKW